MRVWREGERGMRVSVWRVAVTFSTHTYNTYLKRSRRMNENMSASTKDHSIRTSRLKLCEAGEAGEAVVRAR